MTAWYWALWAFLIVACTFLLVFAWVLVRRAEDTYDAAEAVLDEARVERRHAANVNARWQG